MLARIRGAIDSQIAAEQAKVRVSTGSLSNTPGLSRSSSRARASSRNSAPSKYDVEKDPSEFEDSDVATPATGGTPVGTPARSGTPVQTETVTEDPLGAMGGEAADDGKEKETKEKVADAQKVTGTNRLTATSAGGLASNSELPTEVRVKLRKLEKMEVKYSGNYSLLYRVFETSTYSSRITEIVQDRTRSQCPDWTFRKSPTREHTM
jgi:hypothetical protein